MDPYRLPLIVNGNGPTERLATRSLEVPSFGTFKGGRGTTYLPTYTKVQGPGLLNVKAHPGILFLRPCSSFVTSSKNVMEFVSRYSMNSQS